MDWTNLAAFLIVAVPSIMLATHAVAAVHTAVTRSVVLAYARRVLAETLTDDAEETLREEHRQEAKPYATREEWKHDLLYGDIDTVVYRMGKGVPPKKKPPVDLGAVVDRGLKETNDRTAMDAGITKFYPELLIAGASLALLTMMK